MGLDMMTMMLKGMGVDPAALLNQAAALGRTFEAIQSRQLAMAEQLDRMLDNQLAVMTAMGLYVPPPDGEVAALIAKECKRLIDAGGGPADAPAEVSAATVTQALL